MVHPHHGALYVHIKQIRVVTSNLGECPQDFIEKYCKSCGTQRCDRTKEYLNGCPYYNAYMCKTKNNAMEDETKFEPKFKIGDRVVNAVFNKVATIIGYDSDTNLYNIKYDDGYSGRSLENELLTFIEKESKPKFKVGDKIKWYNHTCNITSIDTNENTHIYLIKHNDYREDKIFAKWVPENELTFEDDEKLKLESTKKVREYWSEYARIFIEIYDDEPNECVFTHLWVVSEQRRKGYGKKALMQAEEIAKELGCHIAHLKVETDSWMHKWYLRCGYKWHKNAPDNYTWLTKNLNDMEKKRPKYPQTYEECCKILFPNSVELGKVLISGYKCELLEKFGALLICRDAYWRIAGEEMGLDKPWEPDWGNQKLPKYCIAGVEGQIKTAERYIVNTILAFPTAEMRDAFYEVFKEEIEICKELL